MKILRKFAKRRFTVIASLLTAGIAFNVGYICYLAFWPFPTADYYNLPFPVINQQPIEAGSVLRYEVNYCRYTQVPATVTRTLVGPTITTLSQISNAPGTGCGKAVISNAVIPDYITPGNYYLHIVACYQVSPLQTQCKEAKTAEFTVTRSLTH